MLGARSLLRRDGGLCFRRPTNCTVLEARPCYNGSSDVPMQRGSGAGGGRRRQHQRSPCPLQGASWLPLRSLAPFQLFPRASDFNYPWSTCQFSSGKSKSGGWRKGFHCPPTPPHLRDVPFLCYSVKFRLWEELALGGWWGDPGLGICLNHAP